MKPLFNTEKYSGSDEPLRYMPCIKLYSNGYITISSKLAKALSMEGDIEYVRFFTHGDTEPAPVFITTSAEHLSLGTAWRQPDGSYIIQRDNRQPLSHSIIESMSTYFGLTMEGNDRYLSAKTSIPVSFDGETHLCIAVKRFIRK